MYGKPQDRAIGRTAILAGALTAALLIGGTGGYVLGSGAGGTKDATKEAAPAQEATGGLMFSEPDRSQPGQRSTLDGIRWTHEERPFEAIQLGPASRWTHEERDFAPIQLGPLPRITHEDAFPNP